MMQLSVYLFGDLQTRALCLGTDFFDGQVEVTVSVAFAVIQLPRSRYQTLAHFHFSRLINVMENVFQHVNGKVRILHLQRRCCKSVIAIVTCFQVPSSVDFIKK